MSGQFVKPTLCVSHCSGGIAIYRTEVTLTVNQRISQREVLCHPHHRVVKGLISMRVELTHNLAHGTSGFAVAFFMRVAGLVHTPEDSAVNWLESISYIGKGSANDDTHGIIDVTLFHLLRDVSTQ